MSQYMTRYAAQSEKWLATIFYKKEHEALITNVSLEYNNNNSAWGQKNCSHEWDNNH